MKKLEAPDMLVTLLKPQDILCAESTTPQVSEIKETDTIN